MVFHSSVNVVYNGTVWQREHEKALYSLSGRLRMLVITRRHFFPSIEYQSRKISQIPATLERHGFWVFIQDQGHYFMERIRQEDIHKQ